MEKNDVMSRMEGWLDDPNNPVFCDALCDAAEYLGLPPGEYQYEDLLEMIENVD